MLRAIGANGLRRINADKHRAMMLLLDDPEWSTRSNVAIAQACGVSDRFVGEVRKAISDPIGDSPAAPGTRTVTRNGTTYEQTVKVRLTATPKPSNATAPAPAGPSNQIAQHSSCTKQRPSTTRNMIAQN